MRNSLPSSITADGTAVITLRTGMSDEALTIAGAAQSDAMPLRNARRGNAMLMCCSATLRLRCQGEVLCRWVADGGNAPCKYYCDHWAFRGCVGLTGLWRDADFDVGGQLLRGERGHPPKTKDVLPGRPRLLRGFIG